jgi:hypothetical protein
MLPGSLFQDKSLGLTTEATMNATEVVDKTERVIALCLEWCRENGRASIRGIGIDSFALSLLGVDAGARGTP